MTRWGLVLGLGSALLLAAPAQAAEPDGPDELVSRTDAIYFSIQDKLTNKAREFGADKAEQLALTAYYGNRNGSLLWVTDSGLRQLARLTELESLSLGRTRVTDAGIRELVSLRQLKYLLLRETNVTVRGQQALRESLPDVQIID